MEWNDHILAETYKKSIKKDSIGVTNESAQTQSKQSKYTRDYVNKSGVPNRRFFIWKVGMPCRALYHEDGLEYEATIKGETEHGYIVEYVGYGNEEEVPNNELKITAGKEARERQLMESQQQKEGDLEEDDEEEEEDFTSDGIYVKQQNTSKQQNTFNSQKQPTQPQERWPPRHIAPRDYGQSTSRNMPPPPPQGMSNRHYGAPSNERVFNNLNCGNPNPNMRYREPVSGIPKRFPSMPLPMPLPMPPMPPMPSNRGELDRVESSMLMNWYMCGYYTGLHQAMKSSNK